MPSPTAIEEQRLKSLLQDTIIPHVRKHGVSDLFFAYPSWRVLQQNAFELPSGTHVTHKPLRGKRVRPRIRRSQGKLSIEQNRWPEDKLLSARAPKLCFVTEGPIAFQIADYVFHCGPGHGILLPSGTANPDGTLPVLDMDVAGTHQRSCEILMLLPRQGSLSCWTSRQLYDKDGNMTCQSDAFSILQSLVTPGLHQLVDELTRRQLHWKSISDDLLHMLYLRLHRELQELPLIRTSSRTSEEALDGLSHETHAITRAEEYIHSNLRWPLTIDQVARAVYMSRTTFVEQFHARTGKTFTEYVNDCRFEEICRLLKGSDLSINHISLQVGIQPRSLRLLVQQRTGITPTALRRNFRNEISG